MCVHVACSVQNAKALLRDGSTDQIATTVATVLADYFKASERTMFWNDDLKKNLDPFEGLEGGFFTADWDFKVRGNICCALYPY